MTDELALSRTATAPLTIEQVPGDRVVLESKIEEVAATIDSQIAGMQHKLAAMMRASDERVEAFYRDTLTPWTNKMDRAVTVSTAAAEGVDAKVAAAREVARSARVAALAAVTVSVVTLLALIGLAVVLLARQPPRPLGPPITEYAPEGWP